MADQTHPVSFPHYSQPVNPKGILPADVAQSKLLFKAIRTFSKVSRARIRSRRGLTAPDTVAIRHKKPKFY